MRSTSANQNGEISGSYNASTGVLTLDGNGDAGRNIRRRSRA